jgi:hypothetical protein
MEALRSDRTSYSRHAGLDSARLPAARSSPQPEEGTMDVVTKLIRKMVDAGRLKPEHAEEILAASDGQLFGKVQQLWKAGELTQAQFEELIAFGGAS